MQFKFSDLPKRDLQEFVELLVINASFKTFALYNILMRLITSMIPFHSDLSESALIRGAYETAHGDSLAVTSSSYLLVESMVRN